MPKKDRKRTSKRKIIFSAKTMLRSRKTKKLPEDPEALEFLQFPVLLPKSLDKEQRRRLIIEGAIKAKVEFEKKLHALAEWFSTYDQIYLLSLCAFYYLSYKEGEDPEVTGDLKIPPYFVEILQAIALCSPRNFKVKSLAPNAEEFERTLNDINSLMSFSLFSSLREDMTDEQMAVQKLTGDIVLQNIGVRNWAYLFQMRRIVMDLVGLVEDRIERIFSIKLGSFVRAIYAITEEREALLNDHIDKIRAFMKIDDYKETINTYDRLFPENNPCSDVQIEEIWQEVGRNIENLRGLMAFQAELKTEHIYSFSLDHFLSAYGDSTKRAGVKALLDQLSYEFGDLEKHPRDYFVRDNPVHNRPFIKTDDSTYFSAIYYILPHLMLEIVERIIDEDAGLRSDFLDKIKPSYLEKEVGGLFRSKFPNAEIFSGSLWSDGNVGKVYENDLLVIMDTFALVIEAKSGNIPHAARRGGILRLEETLKGLVEAPSEQAQRFIEFLRQNRKEHIFPTKRGEANRIDCSKVNYFVPISVTLSSLGVVGSNLRKIVEAGITTKKMSELAVSISLTDLECVMEILDYEAEIIHYFFRRREMDDHVDYEGDELDLLKFYLDNGFNIGKAEFDKTSSFLLVSGSKSLDPFFVGEKQDKSITKPRHQMSRWWGDLLMRLSIKRPANWIETSFILLNAAKSDQDRFEKAVNHLIWRIKKKRTEKKHNWVRFILGPEQRRFCIIGLPYVAIDKEERNALVETIIASEESKSIRGVVVIGIDLNRTDYPYSFMAGRLDSYLSCL